MPRKILSEATSNGRSTLALTTTLFLLVQSDEEMYHGLRNRAGKLCCGLSDCRAYTHDDIRYEPNLQILYEGDWLDVPDHAVLPQGSWDGMMRACVKPGHHNALGDVDPSVVCVMFPGVS